MIDLHLHSTFSDGTCSPEQVVSLAGEVGLSAAILTDHDNYSGWERFQSAANGAGIKTMPGMEVSADMPGRTVHMLAYGFDPENSALAEATARVRNGRAIRNNEILAKLSRLGCRITMTEVLAEAGSPDLIARPHIANALVKKGFARDRRDAFARFLARGAAAYADRYRMTPEEVIRTVHAAGGFVSLAHPGSTMFDPQELDDFVGALASAGLDGIETYYTGHLPWQVELYRSLAKKYGLVTTGGSDFHGENKPTVKVGVAFGGLNVGDEIFDAILDRIKRGFA